jgi:predicted DNA-binding protein (MmcQ/YjbR family)
MSPPVTEPARHATGDTGRPALTATDLRDLCLGLPDTVEEFPFDPELSVFKVAGKMFALSKLTAIRPSVSVKVDPDLAVSLRSAYTGIEPGYHLNKRHWITVDLCSDVDGTLARQLVEDSYDLVRPKRPRR